MPQPCWANSHARCTAWSDTKPWPDGARRLAEPAPDVRVHLGDGRLGWPDDAPYSAILVAAGDPEPPDALKQQLEVGDRLGMPIGKRTGSATRQVDSKLLSRDRR